MVFESRQVWTSSQLPSLSILGMRVLELSRRPETGARQLAELLCADSGMALRVVNAANSPLIASPARVESVEQAVSVLGTAAVTSLVLTLEVGDACLNRGAPTGTAAEFWRQAVAKAMITRNCSPFSFHERLGPCTALRPIERGYIRS